MLDKADETNESKSQSRSRTSSPSPVTDIVQQTDQETLNRTDDKEINDCEDDLEVMMRNYREKEERSIGKEKDTESSLSLLMSNYGEANKKQDRTENEKSIIQ